MKRESDSLAEMLLSEPGKLVPEEKFDRPSVEVSVFEKFDSRKLPRHFSRQYAHSYSVRLRTMRPKLQEMISSEWPGVPVKKIAELCEFTQAQVSSGNNQRTGGPNKRRSDDHGQHIAFREDKSVAVIGTIFKIQPEKPSVLQDFAQEKHFADVIPVLPKTKYTSEKDTIQLEDETTHVDLVPTSACELSVSGVVNGVICAVKGRPTMNGKFVILDVIFPTPKPAPELGLSKLDGEMIFISGLEIGCDKKSLAFKVDILFDFLEGLAGCPSEIENLSRTKVFFVGNTITKFIEDDKGKAQTNQIEIMQRIDKLLDDLSRTVDVFILPGENDPSEPTFPQFPIHYCVLPLSTRRQTFRALTNPARIQIPVSNDGESPKLDVILSSGQNVTDALRNSETTSPLEMAQTILNWGNLFPTAPDTLPLHPGVEEDVFVVDTLPHVFVIGNQPTFDSMEWLNTIIFTVPKFSETGTVVLLNREKETVPLKIALM